MAERAFFVLNAVIWVGYGLYCFFVPSVLTDSAGLVASSATANTELRAMYGGAQLGIGVLCGLALLRPGLRHGVLLALLCIVGGLGTTRLVGALIDQGFSGYTWMGLAFEWVIVAACVALLGASRGREAAPANP